LNAVRPRPVNSGVGRLTACILSNQKVYSDLKGVDFMVTREEVIAEIQKVPEKHLDELYQIIKDYEMVRGEDESNQSVMSKLRQIKISASPDFSVKANLYDVEEQNAK
jgi:hypothetical protein